MRGDPTGFLILSVLAATVVAVVFYLRAKKSSLRNRELEAAQTNLSQKHTATLAILTGLNKKFSDQADVLARLLKVLNETGTFYPSLAEAIADFHALEAERTAAALETKKHPATVAATQVREAARARRLAEKELRLLKYQLLSYESMFPWLTDVAGRSTTDLLSEWRSKILVQESPDASDIAEPERDWLSPEEYAQLSSAERADLALSRWFESRRASAWEAGRDYERYVGYLYEQDGFVVDYWGAIEGLGDLGRDLIARKDGLTAVVQCKRWSEEKTIHEKHIFQLIGTCLEYACVNHRAKAATIELAHLGIRPVLVTTTACSQKAREVATLLGVDLRERLSLAPYPAVKCNASGRDRSLIYHLPFDQQYDKVRIEPAKGERYVTTAAEAEALGFRRAFRHRGR